MFLADIPLNIDWQQIVLHVLNLVILVGGLYLLLYNPVKKFMNNRKKYYEDLQSENLEALNNSKKKEEELDLRLKNLNEEISNQKNVAKKEIEKYKSAEIAKAQKEAEMIVENAIKEAQAMKDRIIAESNDEISKIVSEATEKLVLNSTTSDAYDRFLNNVLEGSENNE